MFNLSGSEILFLLVAGLVVLGPERLPGVIRKATKTYSDLRSMARNFESEFKETFDEPLKELRSTADELRSGFGQVDTEPSPPMRPEQAVLPPDDTNTDAEGAT
ncbi:MAG: putative Sec-independent protein translocase protein TatB [Actinomycetota bacterium]